MGSREGKDGLSKRLTIPDTASKSSGNARRGSDQADARAKSEEYRIIDTNLNKGSKAKRFNNKVEAILST